MDHFDITIIGAGLTGITAASRLQKNGKKVLLIDKGNNVGGRLATSCLAKGRADHGAQFFTVRTKDLQQEVDDWLEKGWIKHWFGDDYPRYTSVNGMNSLAVNLADGLPTKLNTSVSHWRKEAGKYRIAAEGQSGWLTEKVILTTPGPQAVEILQNSGIDAKALQEITFQPTYVGMFRFNHPTALPKSGHVDQELPAGVERLVDHYKKGISNEVVVSIYMTADWSAEHFGKSDVLVRMKKSVQGYFDFEDLQSQQLKTWRYAQAVNTYPGSYAALTNSVLVAGDAFLRHDDAAGRTRFESAFLSGIDVAEAAIV
ncbi:NAD(P)/FAD-dependent oxidoreductase [Halobacillus andaensis]|uniref:NAD(P)/FAD-dependent oxidoreductase n=1 Tax=Halobacillus andaensis TaxID=1176239 RepID=UPI003D7068D1